MTLLTLLLACGEKDGDDSAPAVVEHDCTLGTLASGAFVPLEGQRAELVLGFQGFLFVSGAVRVEDPPDRLGMLGATYGVEVEGEAPFGATQPQLLMDGDLTPELLIFMADPEVGRWAERQAQISVRLDGPTFTCISTADVVLADDDPCVMTSGAPECPDTAEP